MATTCRALHVAASGRSYVRSLSTRRLPTRREAGNTPCCRSHWTSTKTMTIMTRSVSLELPSLPLQLPSLRAFSSAASAVNDVPSGKTDVNRNNKEIRVIHETPLPPLPASSFNPKQLAQDIFTAAEYNQGTDRWQLDFCRRVFHLYLQHLQYILDHNLTTMPDAIHLVSAEITERAIKGMIRQHLHPTVLSKHVRQVERLIGSIAQTPLTEWLSFRLLEANGKAGNVGRTLALLHLRKSRGYDAHPHEFLYAVASIKAAGTDLLVNRNLYASDAFQPEIDNPTRWLDAILLNMHDRKVPLTIEVANRMLETYSSTGRTGKAVHHFWKMYLTPIPADGDIDDYDSQPTVLIDPLQLSPEDIITTKDTMVYQNRKHRAKLVWRSPPPREKVPSEIRGAVFSMGGGGGGDGTTQQQQRRTKLDWEQQQDWSLALTAAFSFADSLTHGACGHGPVELNVDSWNALIKACCYRGALWRAMQVLEETMPSKGIVPDAYSYTLLLDGLAKVGDLSSMRDYFWHVQNKDLVRRSNVRAMVDGMINAGDVAGAVTFLQDMYNQHQIIVKHNVHLKVLEVALASDLVWEAERYVTVMEQIRSHEMNFAWDEPDFCRMLETFQKDPRTSRESIRKVFAYYGETLDERNFLPSTAT